ncbi:MAG TPA: hypothetical protein VIV57_01830 [Anaeromyxobacter sp.]
MRTRANDVRECIIVGHRLEVYLRHEGQWRVVVDGEESAARYATPYAAWAAGAAESYRLGRTPGFPASHD